MDNKPRKKRQPVAPSIKKSSQPSTQTVNKTSTHESRLSSLGIELNHETTKQAIILSEIIGKPVSKRKIRR